MSTFVLLHGAGGTGAYWGLVTGRLETAGHHVLAPDLPNHPGATFADQADAVVALVGPPEDDPVVLVAQSMGAYAAALAAERVGAARIVLVDAMVPAPGESAGAWWEATGQPAARAEAERAAGRDPDAPFDLEVVFLHDVPAPARALLEGDGEPAGSLFEEPFALPRWPDVATTVVVSRDDRMSRPRSSAGSRGSGWVSTSPSSPAATWSRSPSPTRWRTSCWPRPPEPPRPARRPLSLSKGPERVGGESNPERRRPLRGPSTGSGGVPRAAPMRAPTSSRPFDRLRGRSPGGADEGADLFEALRGAQGAFPGRCSGTRRRVRAERGQRITPGG